MWIRSQNKEELVNVNRVQVDGKRICTAAGVDSDGCESLVVLGRYNDKARAMEVLNDIQQKLINGTKFDKIDRFGERVFRESVYEMPQV